MRIRLGIVGCVSILCWLVQPTTGILSQTTRWFMTLFTKSLSSLALWVLSCWEARRRLESPPPISRSVTSTGKRWASRATRARLSSSTFGRRGADPASWRCPPRQDGSRSRGQGLRGDLDQHGRCSRRGKVKPLIKRGGYGFTVLLDKDTSVVSQYNPPRRCPTTCSLTATATSPRSSRDTTRGMRSSWHEVEALLGRVADAGVLAGLALGLSNPHLRLSSEARVHWRMRPCSSRSILN